MGLFHKRSNEAGDKKEPSKNEARLEPPKAQPEPPLPTLNPGERLFRHVPLGSGGTFVLNQSSESSSLEGIRYIGTTVCLNSVGVFFELSDTKCFCAHIDAFVDAGTMAMIENESAVEDGGYQENNNTKGFRKHYATNFMTARSLRDQVFSRLDAASQAGSWGPKSVRMRMTLVMNCAKMYGQEPQAAEVVAKAVREWLGAGATDKGKRAAKSGAAFVVGWPGAGVKVFDHAPSSEWSAVDAGVGDADWSFGVDDAGLQGSEEAW